MSDLANLTLMEVDALTDVDGTINLTDGHARLLLSDSQREIVERLPDMFTEASRRGFADIEAEAHATFLGAIGQHSAPVATGRILSCYSSTLATDIVARAIPAGTTLAVLHPTFDNIADLMVTRGLRLIPLSEADLLAHRWPGRPVGGIVITHPNNPTGLVTPPEAMRSLGEHAAREDQLVIVDASFRGQVPAAQYDCYEILESAGARWIVLEDTGKLWPTHELKIGMLAWSARVTLPIQRAFSESLLSASPLVLLLVTELARDWTAGGSARARALVRHNRATVRAAAAEVGLIEADPSSEISVSRIQLPHGGPDSAMLYRDLLQRGVHVLPCPPFHWADPAEGLRFIRLSLSRPTHVVDRAAAALAQSYRELSGASSMRRDVEHADVT